MTGCVGPLLRKFNASTAPTMGREVDEQGGLLVKSLENVFCVFKRGARVGTIPHRGPKSPSRRANTKHLFLGKTRRGYPRFRYPE